MINNQAAKLSSVIALGIFASSCAVQNQNNSTQTSAADTSSSLGSFLSDRVKHIAETPERIAKTGSAMSGPVYKGYWNGKYVTCQPGGMPVSTESKGSGSARDKVVSQQKVTIGITPLPICDELIKTGQVQLVSQGPTSGDTSAEAVPSDYVNIEKTEIYRIFEKYPQPGGGAFAEWPRVAITVIDAPPWHLEDKIKRGPMGMVAGTKAYPTEGCWKFKAKVWESKSKSHDVGPFYHCTKDQLRMPKNKLLISYNTWSGLQGSSFTRTKLGSTGILRTDGPNYPDTPLPTSMPYQRANFGTSFTAEVACGILGATGIDFTAHNDYRVWFNLSPALEPK